MFNNYKKNIIFSNIIVKVPIIGLKNISDSIMQNTKSSFSGFFNQVCFKHSGEVKTSAQH